MSGILEAPEGAVGPRSHETATIDSETGEPSPRRSRRKRTRQKHRLPPFPMKPDSLVTNLEERREQLENWLQMFLHIPINRNHHETAEFLEVSRYSFVNDLGGKHTEGFIKKQPGGLRNFVTCKQFCVRYLVPWGKRWLMVRDSFVAYMDPKTERIRLVMLMDWRFAVEAGAKETEDGIPTGLTIHNAQTDSDFPVRENSYAKWWGKIRKILSMPNLGGVQSGAVIVVMMKRPALQGIYWRLDQILLRKAQQGVKIFILIYKEVEQALGLNSMHTKRYLQGLHENIKVMRHPDHIAANAVFFWAHHEKLLIIDQLISFVGGVDLCLGRWDFSDHLLTDLGSVQFSETHAVNHDLQSGLRALIKAPLTLSPLGLEESEIVTPRDTDPVRLNANAEGRHNSIRQFTKIQIGEDVDQIDYVNTSGRVQPIAEETNEVVYTDKETGEVMVKVIRRTPSPNPPSERPQQLPAGVQNAGFRHSSPSPSRLAISSLSTPTGGATTSQGGTDISGGSGKRPTMVKIVQDTKGKKQVKRFISAIEKKSPVPQEILDKAGPAPSIFDKAAKQGMDLAEVASRYKEYVESGAVEKEKHRAATPPLGKRKTTGTNRLSRAVGNWKANRAKRKWKQMLNTDEMTLAYELDWLRLKEIQEDNDHDQRHDYAQGWRLEHKKGGSAGDNKKSDFIDRGVTPRMPWHDIHSVTFGAPARDVARHFIQRWNATKTEKLKDDHSYPFLLPKSYENLKVPRVFKSPNISEQVNVQMLRSMAGWSGLINYTDDSIQMAYASLIANSKHYIYIENQFFVSMIDTPDVRNEICKCICDRIIRAHKDKETFRVYILIPLLPGFEGDVGAPGGSALQAVLHWTYQSLSQGEHCLLNKLKPHVDDPFKYLSVCSLRTYDYLGRKLVGNRDSEVCLVFNDVIKEKSMMNGKPYQAGKFAKSLRMQCMKVFRAYPTDHVETFEEYKKWKSQMPLAEYSPQQAEEKLRDLRGVLVEFPMNFLSKAVLTPSFLSKEGLVSKDLFT
ncbi:hypothetical protein WR25_15387 isoform E [Diploscapter pachys]|nr:hypothetical protein WR25_15387 isoform B [Diploscapter pachys]PAV86395.1 hypothetical protein WR25_15387 isoform D [Diploscapter pachys]PAV86396.1 hypothetical protein WR25_15387 isoform E [Diploscapter pachys]